MNNICLTDDHIPCTGRKLSTADLTREPDKGTHIIETIPVGLNYRRQRRERIFSHTDKAEVIKYIGKQIIITNDMGPAGQEITTLYGTGSFSTVFTTAPLPIGGPIESTYLVQILL
jgi:hypothetical protein